ncbi:Chlorophyll A-B binding protein [Seminavis robusta]|uniref:Chlorophyll A-B binding protein n=1 Tax=Seminavis robusta TaxID=568900 RepID=A0A9N8DBW1_9STRA|nr:Chlorophyll A-B binding protein [Seminavis robusta]|eukprot:Sro49_g028640.1 Chlorophyll A-B binding protein (203) ;mRNA; f:67942-68645
MMKMIATLQILATMALSVSGFAPALRPHSTTTLQALSFNDNVLARSDLPGNFGFDPLHLAQTPQQLVTYRKAEMKHARLAMLAVIAIMWSDAHVVDTLGATPFVEGRVFPELLGASLGLPAALELYGERVEEDHQDDKSYFPGQLDLDPFHLYPAETTGQRRVQFAEIMIGRVCMMAAAARMTDMLLDAVTAAEPMEDLIVV